MSITSVQWHRDHNELTATVGKPLSRLPVLEEKTGRVAATLSPPGPMVASIAYNDINTLVYLNTDERMGAWESPINCGRDVKILETDDE